MIIRQGKPLSPRLHGAAMEIGDARDGKSINHGNQTVCAQGAEE